MHWAHLDQDNGIHERRESELSQRNEHNLKEEKYKGFEELRSRTFGNGKEFDRGS